jgi:2-polyprenyl-3-methyl-5-hydroxy-6-metoxy-1,4-benzoquinol methylase
MHRAHVVSDDAYNIIRILPADDGQSALMEANRSYASKVSADPSKRFEYVKYIESTFIDPIAAPGHAPRDILIIGAGGFTMGLGDNVSNYTFVDIDSKLKDVAEKDFLKQKLGSNKHFVADSAREFVHSGKQQYDLIVLDTYTNVVSIPMECTTQEFLRDVKARLKPGGIVVANVISTPTFRDKFSVRYAHTFGSVFPTYTRQIIRPFNAWDSARPDPALSDNTNILFISFNNRYADDNMIYTDDKNTYSIDR